MKPKLKYFTTIDFGRTLTMNDFKELGDSNNLKIEYEIIESMKTSEIAKIYYIGYIFKLFNKFGFKDYDVNQYKITMSK